MCCGIGSSPAGNFLNSQAHGAQIFPSFPSVSLQGYEVCARLQADGGNGLPGRFPYLCAVVEGTSLAVDEELHASVFLVGSSCIFQYHFKAGRFVILYAPGYFHILRGPVAQIVACHFPISMLPPFSA